ncbi:MAG: Zn-dependent oligopeptidase [Elusimicrobia bacterium]|nr:Zn-dependent oligopeptidase [Elusimicrobiota bacterium]
MKRIFLTGVVWFLISGSLAASVAPSALLRYDLKPEEIKTVCKAAKEKSESDLKTLVDVPVQTRSFDNTPLALENALAQYADEISGPTFLKYVSTDKAVRDAAHDCEVDSEQYAVEVYTREELYSAIKAYVDKGGSLAGEDKKLLEKILLEFKRNGFGLDAEKRAQVKELKKLLIDMELTFGKNINEYKDHLELSRQELEGLPDDFVNRLSITKEGKYIVTLDYPDYFPFMENAKNDMARHDLQFKFDNRCSTTNVRLLEDAISLRYRIAHLLGYSTFAHYVLEDRMAKSPERVSEFLSSARKKLKTKARQELKERLELKAKDMGKDQAKRLDVWQWRYYNNQLKKLRYDVDQEKIKEYFPLEVVSYGMLEVYQKLLGLRYEKEGDPDRWHADVELYRVFDAKTNDLIGHFYMDLFPREGKYKHAAAFTLVKGRRLPDGSYQKPVSSIVANFNKPTADRPSLLTHDEVETLFHEFGHIMHQVLTRAKYGRFSGTSVARDFVEAPSQMLENWVWNKDVLKSLSGHYQDKTKKLPDDLLGRMIKAKNFDSGLRYLRQNFFGAVDLEYHTKPLADTTALYAKLMEEVSLIPMTEGTHPQASFGHLMGGYEAAYYGYMWSEVYSADMFSRFEKEGIMNPELGLLYRKLILEPGRSEDEEEQLKKFLGRAPSDEAFLRSIGVK